MKKRKRGIILLLFLCLFLGGCGGKENADGSRNDTGGTADLGAPKVTQSETMLSVKTVKSIHFEKPEEGYKTGSVTYEIMDGGIYLLRVEFPAETAQEDSGQRLCMQIYDSAAEKKEKIMLSPEVPGHEEYVIYSVGLTPEGEISFKMRDREDETRSFFLVKTDLQGNVLEVVEPFPEETSPWNAESWSGVETFHLEDGRTLVSRWDENAMEAVLTWFDGEDAGKILGKQEGSNPGAVCSGEDGILYCLSGNSLLRWDVEKEVREELFRLQENGIEISMNSGLIRTAEGELLLCRMNGEEVLIYVLTDEEIVADDKIRIACVQMPSGIDYIQKRAANFARETGSIPVKMETRWEEYQDEYRSRIMAELTAGKGPEMMWLSYEDLVILAEKGVLLDLSDMIPENLKSQMIPAALEMGTVDGKLVGFTPHVEFSTMITMDSIWAENSWTVSEFTELVESKQEWEALVSWNSVRGVDRFSLFFWVFMNDIANSSFLDLEQGISFFDSEEFIRVLEICKNYGKDSYEQMDKDEWVRLLKEGRIAANINYIYDFSQFSRDMETYGEECNMVGFPRESGSGSYIHPYSYGFLAVNAKAEHKEEIGKFIAYLLDYDQQFTVPGCSVRMDVIKNSIVYNEWSGYRVRCSASEENMIVKELVVKPDGTTYLEEFMDFLDNCQPEAATLQQIRNILGNELTDYLAGNKSAEDVAGTIQNRVQVYLDENR